MCEAKRLEPTTDPPCRVTLSRGVTLSDVFAHLERRASVPRLGRESGRSPFRG